jgi:Uma2 family endonuclease
MATVPLPFVTPEQYLAYDRQSDERNEYLYGEIQPVQGATLRHAQLAMNAGIASGKRLSDSACSAFSSSLRVSLDPKDGYVYPDVTVLCGKPEYLGKDEDIVTNPKLVIEVLSPSTMNRDLACISHEISSVTPGETRGCGNLEVRHGAN